MATSLAFRSVADKNALSNAVLGIAAIYYC